MHTVKSDSISLSQNMNEHTGMPGYALVACTPVSLERHGLPAMCRPMCRARCRATLAMVRGAAPAPLRETPPSTMPEGRAYSRCGMPIQVPLPDHGSGH